MLVRQGHNDLENPCFWNRHMIRWNHETLGRRNGDVLPKMWQQPDAYAFRNREHRERLFCPEGGLRCNIIWTLRFIVRSMWRRTADKNEALLGVWRLRHEVSCITKKDRLWLWTMKFGRVLGCHQKPERSFRLGAYQFPLCARCTGVMLSLPVTVILFWKKRILPSKWAAVFAGILF